MIIFDIRINYFVCIIIDLGCSKKRAPGLWMLRKTPPPWDINYQTAKQRMKLKTYTPYS